MAEAFRPISLDLGAEQICAQLDRLDDAVFAALNGCENSLSEVERLWPQAIDSLDQRLLEETRTHYMQWAREIIDPAKSPLTEGPSLTARQTVQFLHATSFKEDRHSSRLGPTRKECSN